ncbi:MAG: IPT/TIG domain-containing protein [Ferruginibacter sp.]
MKKNPLLMLAGIVMLVCSSCKKSDSTPAPVPDTVPVISSISPASGPKNTVVTITGTDFGTNLATLKVYFNNVQATVQSATNTEIRAVVPASAGTGAVKVEKKPGVQASGPIFTYLIPGETTTFAGSSPGYLDGTGANALFSFPYGLINDAGGNIYVADRSNNRIRKITPAGVVSTIAGNSNTGNANGVGTAAEFNYPLGLCADFAQSTLYIADFGNHRIRKVIID